MPSRSLNDISARFQPFCFELLARVTSAGIPVLVVCTLRSIAEETVNVAAGTSSTMNSRHLPQLPDNKAMAIDICPYDIYQLHGPDKLKWDSSDPVWATIGAIGEEIGTRLGLHIRWGGRWKTPHDPGHFELDE